jgi:NAD(P)-dependent dehydrogenase (short-subunit alcohol dehydrogenase family)
MLPPNAVWFITGCSTGLGRTFASYALSQSQRVAATARNPDTLDYLPSQSPDVLKLSLDVTSPESVDAGLASTIERFGRIDVVVNNAGINAFGHAEAYSMDVLRGMMETNFWGAMDVCSSFFQSKTAI